MRDAGKLYVQNLPFMVGAAEIKKSVISSARSNPKDANEVQMRPPHSCGRDTKKV